MHEASPQAIPPRCDSCFLLLEVSFSPRNLYRSASVPGIWLCKNDILFICSLSACLQEFYSCCCWAMCILFPFFSVLKSFCMCMPCFPLVSSPEYSRHLSICLLLICIGSYLDPGGNGLVITDATVCTSALSFHQVHRLNAVEPYCQTLPLPWLMYLSGANVIAFTLYISVPRSAATRSLIFPLYLGLKTR